jgi:hypothetical protein
MFLIDFLFALPLWSAAFVLTVFFCGFAMAALWTMRRWVLPRLRLDSQDTFYTSTMVQFAMLLYGLVAAMTAVSVWQRYAQVSDIVSAESTAIVSLWRDLGGYPVPLRDATRETLRGYTAQIIDEAWPQQQMGITPRGGVAWMDKLQAQIYAFEPATEGQRVLHAEVLDAFNHLSLQRRARVDAVHGGLPGVFWLVLIPGAMCCIVLCLLFKVSNVRLQVILLLGASVFLAMVVFIIVALDRPFIGEAGISAESYRLVYEHHMKPAGNQPAQ